MTLRQITAALLILGGLNWGLIGLFQFNLVSAIFGGNTAALSRVVYILVGLSAIYQMFIFPWSRRRVLTDERDTIKRAA